MMLLLQEGKPLYHIDRVIKEMSENFGDRGTYFVNPGAYQDGWQPYAGDSDDFPVTDVKI